MKTYWQFCSRFSIICIIFAFRLGLAVEFISPPRIVQNPNPAVPLAAVVSFDSNNPVSTTIEFSDGSHTQAFHYGADSDPQHGLPAMGMKPNTTYTVDIKIVDAKAPHDSATTRLNYKTPPLPSDPLEFPKIQVGKGGAEHKQGITLFNPRRRIPRTIMPASQARTMNQKFGLLVAVNAAGDVIWYYRCDSRISDFEQLRNGHILYLTQDYTAVEIDVLGNVIAKWYATGRPEGAIEQALPVETLTFHHDIEELPNGNFLVLGTDRRLIKDYYTDEWDETAPRKDQWAMGDEIVEFQRDGTVVWRWNAWDHLDPYRFGYQALTGYWVRRGWPETMDWSHCNGLEYNKNDNSILLNSRYMSAVFNIKRNSGEILWIAGEHSGWSPELQKKLLNPVNFDRWFWHQHAPKVTPRGTLLLFDNGNFQARPFDEPTPVAETQSRVVEFAIDPHQKTITKVWSSDMEGDPPVVSFAMGSVQWLEPTQTILSGWGFLLPTEQLEDIEWTNAIQSQTWSRVREYSHIQPTRVLWEVSLVSLDPDLNLGWTTFGARRLETLSP